MIHVYNPIGIKGNNSGPIQADETYYGNTSKRAKHYKKGHSQKSGIVALVEPATGKARAFAVKSATAEKVGRILYTNVRRKAVLVTDESRLYDFVGAQYSEHQTVLHTAGKYVNKDGYTTNNVENFFGIFKKGMVGVYHFCGEQHLQRYLDEFCFRYSNRSGVGINDNMRAALALKGIEGYSRPSAIFFRSFPRKPESRGNERNRCLCGPGSPLSRGRAAMIDRRAPE